MWITRAISYIFPVLHRQLFVFDENHLESRKEVEFSSDSFYQAALYFVSKKFPRTYANGLEACAQPAITRSFKSPDVSIVVDRFVESESSIVITRRVKNLLDLAAAVSSLPRNILPFDRWNVLFQSRSVFLFSTRCFQPSLRPDICRMYGCSCRELVDFSRGCKFSTCRPINSPWNR